MTHRARSTSLSVPAPRQSGPRATDTGRLDVTEWLTAVGDVDAAGWGSVTGRVDAVGQTAVLGQVDVVGGGTATALAAILVFFLAVVLSVVVTYRYARGYLRTRQRPLLYLTVGMLLLAPAPMFIRLVVGNVAVVSPTERTLVVTASKLCGLLAILAVVYRS